MENNEISCSWNLIKSNNSESFKRISQAIVLSITLLLSWSIKCYNTCFYRCFNVWEIYISLNSFDKEITKEYVFFLGMRDWNVLDDDQKLIKWFEILELVNNLALKGKASLVTDKTCKTKRT